MGQDASLRSVPAGGDARSFVLTFKGTADSRRLEQNTYPVEHFALGRFDLFISEGNLVDNEYVYTAVINRTTK